MNAAGIAACIAWNLLARACFKSALLVLALGRAAERAATRLARLGARAGDRADVAARLQQ